MKKTALRIASVLSALLVAGSAWAQDAAHAANEYDVKMFAYLAAGIAIGAAVLGGALGQGRTASAALDGIARNPSASDKIFTPMILALALIESLVILAFITAYFLQSK